MLKHIQVVPLHVKDQDVALAFYTEKLSFEVGTDFTMEDGYRWLTVKLPGTGAPEVHMMKTGPEVDIPAIMGGFVFHSDDCQATYEQLKANGVVFDGPPTKEMWGVQAAFKDPDGNGLLIVQPTPWE